MFFSNLIHFWPCVGSHMISKIHLKSNIIQNCFTFEFEMTPIQPKYSLLVRLTPVSAQNRNYLPAHMSVCTEVQTQTYRDDVFAWPPKMFLPPKLAITLPENFLLRLCNAHCEPYDLRCAVSAGLPPVSLDPPQLSHICLIVGNTCHGASFCICAITDT